MLTVIDGVIAGEGEGPLAPRDFPLGVVIAATDPIALDLVALRLMGFDEGNLPKISRPIGDSDLRITEVRSLKDVAVFEVQADNYQRQQRRLDEIECERVFRAHPGWTGHSERTAP